MNKQMKKFILPAGIVVLTVVGMKLILSNPPEAHRGKPQAKARISVEARRLQPAPYTISVESYGTVRPRTQSSLVAQVSGQIIEISDSFRDGGFFQRGDVLLKLDDRDHKANVKQAQAQLMNAQQALVEEQARGEQAKLDWQRLGKGGQANALVLRTPQLAAAKADVLSAQAQLEKAELDLERTSILAPYSGRILSKSVDVGQVVGTSTQLAEIYASDYVEVRLPIKNKDLALIDLPRQQPGNSRSLSGAEVELNSDLVGRQQWHGRLVRTEGAIDSQAQQLYVVAQIDEPYGDAGQTQFPIKVGQYVTATIRGRTIQDAVVIPNSAIYQGSYVYTVKDGILARREIKIGWQNKQQALISGGLNAGDNLVLTPLGQVSSGTAVTVMKEGDVAQGAAKRGAKL